jgi:hypothetical protein
MDINSSHGRLLVVRVEKVTVVKRPLQAFGLRRAFTLLSRPRYSVAH